MLERTGVNFVRWRTRSLGDTNPYLLMISPLNSAPPHNGFQGGKIRLDKGHWINVVEAKYWFEDFKVATMVPSHVVTGIEKRTNRIGRDRVYHEFSGEIKELLIFEDILRECDIELVENYLLEKWSQDLSVNEAYIRAVRTNNMSKLEELSKQKGVQTSALVYSIKKKSY